MKAIIPAAGYAIRLYPLTENQPKHLLNVGGKPILSHIYEKLIGLPIDAIYIVTNSKFYLHFLKWSESLNENIPVKIIDDGTSSNEDRLGSNGDINFVIETEKIDDDLLIIGGDNLFEEDLEEFLRFFRKKGTSIMLTDVKDKELAKKYGIAVIDGMQKVVDFEEKPENPKSTLASTMIYALQRKHLPAYKKVIELGQADRAGDFIAYLVGRENVYGQLLKGKWFDIGSFESLWEADKAYTLMKKKY